MAGLWFSPVSSSNKIITVFLLAIVLSVLLRYTDSDFPFGILKLFLKKEILDILDRHLLVVCGAIEIRNLSLKWD
jgi:hypothetical protein